MVSPGLTGSLFEPGDSSELREKIVELWSDKNTIIRMGREARNRIENEFSAQRHLSALLDIYAAALAER